MARAAGHRQRCRSRVGLLAAVVLAVSTSLPQQLFVSPPSGRASMAARPQRVQRTATPQLPGGSDNRNPIQIFQDNLKPQLWRMNGPYKMIEDYEGYRTNSAIFWAIVQPIACICFGIMGISSFLGEDLVKWTPFTAEYLWFLSRDNVAGYPYNMFCCFYGFVGVLFAGPLQWWLLANNKGAGFAQFNTEEGYFSIVSDGELQYEVPIAEIEAVRMYYTPGIWVGQREIFVVLESGSEVSFMKNFSLDREEMEDKAGALAVHLGVPLEIVD